MTDHAMVVPQTNEKIVKLDSNIYKYISSVGNEGLNISEFSAVNIYIYNNLYNWHVVNSKDRVLLSGVDTNQDRFLLPVNDISQFTNDELYDLLLTHKHLYPVAEFQLDRFEKDDRFLIENNIDDDDYVYTTEKLANMSGRKLSKRRNLIAQHRKAYNTTFETMSSDRVPDAKSILEKWALTSKGLNDYESVMVALDNFDDLGIEGLISYTDGEPSGMILGERLNNDMYLFHIAKCDTKFKGIYQTLTMEFAKTLDKYKYINFEQDLGDDGLRQAKRAYYPDLIVKKYTVGLN